MDNKKWYKNPEMIVALSALMIGLVTAFTSIYSASVDRAYARASVWPRLEMFRSYNEVSFFKYGVANNGTGPALIKMVKVKQGDKYLKRWSEIKQFSGINATQSHISHRTLAAQDSITPIQYKGKEVKKLLSIDNSISIEICYCSIYEECWLIDRESIPEPIASCVIDKKEAFLQ